MLILGRTFGLTNITGHYLVKPLISLYDDDTGHKYPIFCWIIVYKTFMLTTKY